MSFTLATYNVLAPAYARASLYRGVAKEHLDIATRLPALVDHVQAIGADVLCLQEVEAAVHEAIGARLTPLGYHASFAGKGQGKPDGCATYVRSASFEIIGVDRLEYRDGGPGIPDSGHVAQVVRLRSREGAVTVANTHLKWSPPTLPVEQQYGYRQVMELLERRPSLAPGKSAWVICGDLNVTADSAIIAALRGAGFEASHSSRACRATCNPNGCAKGIDFIFLDERLEAEPLPVPRVLDDTPLPGPGQPSDHVAVVTKLRWRL